MYDLDDFTRYGLTHSRWTPEEFTAAIQTAQCAEWRPEERAGQPGYPSRSCLIRVEPIPRMSTMPYATVVFYINHDKLAELVANTSYASESRTLLVGSRGGLLAAFGCSPEEEMVQQFLKLEQLPAIFRFDGREYEISAVKSDITELTYVSFLDTSVLLDQMQQRLRVMYFSLFAVTALGIVLLCVTMRLNYRPIETLATAVETVGTEPGGAQGDIVLAARRAIVTLTESQRDMRERLMRSAPSLRRFTILKLLNGGYETIAAFNEEGSLFGLHLKPRVCAAVFWFQRTDLEWGALQRGVASAELLSGGQTGVVGTIGGDGHSLFFLFSSDEGAALPDALPVAQAKARLEEACGAPCTVGVGNFYTDARRLRESFVEAKAAADFRFVQGQGQIICFGGTPLTSPEEFLKQYPKEDFDRLAYAVRMRNMERVSAILAEISEKIRGMNAPPVSGEISVLRGDRPGCRRALWPA